MKILKLAAAIFLAALGAGNVAAHPTPQQTTPRATLAEQAEAASIYITAATKKGMLIIDLKPEDLTITEDKVPAKIEKVTCGKPEPLLVGILVDVSGSRRADSHLLEHYDALEGFLHALLAADDGTYIVAYDDKVYKLSELVTDRASISAAFNKLRKYQPSGSTALYDAIKAAAEANFKGRSGRRILLVIGDWEDNSSHITSHKVTEAPQQTSTSVYAILDSDGGLESKKSHKRAVEVATRVTEQTGGLVYEVVEKNDFVRVLQAIGGAVTGSCRVTYTPPRNSHAKKEVKLHVEANSRDVSILYPKVRFSVAQ